jgi:hypothetical protein
MRETPVGRILADFAAFAVVFGGYPGRGWIGNLEIIDLRESVPLSIERMWAPVFTYCFLGCSSVWGYDNDVSRRDQADRIFQAYVILC